METLSKIFPSDVMPEVKKFLECGMPGHERSQLWGHNIAPGFSAEAAKDGYENWDVRKTDVLVASYPKTGTNFLMEVVRRILFQDEQSQKITEVFPPPLVFLEFSPGNKFKTYNKMSMERRFLSTHLPADLVNVEKIKKAGAKCRPASRLTSSEIQKRVREEEALREARRNVIYILRNPKDQIVSWLNFSSKLPAGQVEPLKSMIGSGWNTFFDHVIKGDFEMNSKPGEWYPEHILSWYKHRDNKTVYFVRFEDLKKNPEKEIKLMAEFLEVPITDETVKDIARETSFQKMKQNNENAQNELLKKFRELNMRKGNVGGWKDNFTVSQSERIDAIMEEKLKDTDIKFKYD